jgi:LacI family transcriptional regulator
MKPTLKDIAAICKVSTATVSMVLSGKGAISRTTSDLIQETARQLGYKRKTPQSDHGPSFRNIGIIQWEDSPNRWQFSHTFVIQLERLLASEGFRPVIIHKLPEINDMALYHEIKNIHAGAVFSIHYVNPDLFDQLEEDGIPVILLNNSNFQNRYWSVLTDDVQGAFEGTKHLVSLGHSNIAYMEYARTDLTSVVKDRYFGFRQALEESGIYSPAHHRISIQLPDAHVIQLIADRLRPLVTASETRVTALFVHDDYLGMIVHTALSAMGLAVPRDMSIICPGDVMDYSEPFYPRLTTMQIDLPSIISLAWDLLLNRLISDMDNPKVLKTTMHLVDRGSCAPLA